jgi:hypothetical protein
VLLPATLLKPLAKPNGPTIVSSTAKPTSTAIAASVAGRSSRRSSARGRSARRTGGWVRLQRTRIANGQAMPAKL